MYTHHRKVIFCANSTVGIRFWNAMIRLCQNYMQQLHHTYILPLTQLISPLIIRIHKSADKLLLLCYKIIVHFTPVTRGFGVTSKTKKMF